MLKSRKEIFGGKCLLFLHSHANPKISRDFQEILRLLNLNKDTQSPLEGPDP